LLLLFLEALSLGIVVNILSHNTIIKINKIMERRRAKPYNTKAKKIMFHRREGKALHQF
jgi:hypothetical protein